MKRVLLASMLLSGVTFCVHAQEKAAEKLENQEESGKWEVWRWANFAILAIGAGYLLAKHAPSFFNSRTIDIQKDITEAQKQKREAEARAAEMDARLQTLGAEIEKFRAQAKVEIEQEGSRIREETARQIEKLQRQAEQEIESAGKAATRELSAYAAQLALDLAEQRIRARLDASTEAGLIDDFTRDLARQSSQLAPQSASELALQLGSKN